MSSKKDDVREMRVRIGRRMCVVKTIENQRVRIYIYCVMVRSIIASASKIKFYRLLATQCCFFVRSSKKSRNAKLFEHAWRTSRRRFFSSLTIQHVCFLVFFILLLQSMFETLRVRGKRMMLIFPFRSMLFKLCSSEKSKRTEHSRRRKILKEGMHDERQ